MDRRHLRFAISFVAVLAGIVLAFEVLKQPPESIDTRIVENEELYPLWEDNHVWLEEGRPPWPRGLSESQIDILRHADRIVVGRINPYPRYVNETAEDRFHRHRVFGAVAIEAPDDVAWLANHLIDIRNLGDAYCEFYPAYAIRVWGNDDVLDVLINDDCEAGMYFITSSEKRYLRCSDSAIEFREKLLGSIARQPADVDNR